MNPGYEGVYDMSGNVREWEDSCNGSMGKEDRCRLRGGSFYTDADYLRCDGGVDGSRGDRCEEIGFRCCSAP
jgi:formylglycine-generating enzyme required for sulfatase activity